MTASATDRQPEAQPPALDLSIGIVTFRSNLSEFISLIRSLVGAIDELTAIRPETSVDLYLVSNDGDLRFAESAALVLEQTESQIRVIRTTGHGNIGYGAANNLAIRATRSRYHLVLNPDVVFDEGSVTRAIEYMESHPDAALAAPQAFDGQGEYLRLAKSAPSVLVLLLRGLSLDPHNRLARKLIGRYTYADRLPSPSPVEIELASGCCMLCRTSALKATGGFDERFFLFFEDFDLSRRIGEFGTLVEIPGFRIRHTGGNAARRGAVTVLRFARSAIRYFEMYGWRLI